MDIKIIQTRLENYQCKTPLEEEHALKEITQEIALLSLSRAGFFRQAEFHGGTALRILHGLPRFSEDLDFALLEPNKNFRLHDYLKNLAAEFENYGYQIEYIDRTKANDAVQKAFIKDDSIGKLLLLQFRATQSIPKKMRIKLEVDVNPPTGATTEIKFLDFPSPFSLLAKDLPSSFAGKLHALLCRKYVKGRDWYDFLWYVSHQTSINFILLTNALLQVGPWQGQTVQTNKDWVIEQLHKKIQSIDWPTAVNDVAKFLKPNDLPALELWSTQYFLSKLDQLAKI